MYLFKKKAVVLNLLLAGASIFSGADLGKVPARISYVSGAVNHGYSLVQTTIYRDVSTSGAIVEESLEIDLDNLEELKSQPGAPKIIRAQLDLIGPNKQSSKVLDVKLETPMPPTSIESYGAAQVGHKIGDMVGAVGGPKYGKAGVLISGLSDLADLGLIVAENELNKLYENQNFKIVVLEIIPTRYYRINMNTQAIEPTAEFDNEIEPYNNQMTTYLEAFEQYRKVEHVYTQWHKKLTAFDPAGKKQSEWEKLRAYNRDEVMPKLLEKNKEENAFAKLYSPYRIAIMASAAEPGKSCGSYGKGPWEFFIIYYLGARQTNQIGVRYCVPNNKKSQELGVEIIGNTIQQVNVANKQQKFLPGGIRMYVKNNASFAQSTGLQEGNYGAQKTEVFNFFSEMVTNPMAGKGIGSFLVNFDVADIKNRAKQKGKKLLDSKIGKVLESMDKTIQTAKDVQSAGLDLGALGASPDNVAPDAGVEGSGETSAETGAETSAETGQEGEESVDAPTPTRRPGGYSGQQGGYGGRGGYTGGRDGSGYGGQQRFQAGVTPGQVLGATVIGLAGDLLAEQIGGSDRTQRALKGVVRTGQAAALLPREQSRPRRREKAEAPKVRRRETETLSPADEEMPDLT